MAHLWALLALLSLCITMCSHGPVLSTRSVDQQSCAPVVLYVDLDGVLQHSCVLHHPKRGIYLCPERAAGRSLFEWAHYLVQALEPHPEVRCVLSSSWCIWPGYRKTLERMPADLRSRFVGGTYHSKVHGTDVWARASFRDTPRWTQIWADVQRRRPRAWLAIDDDWQDWPSWARPNLVACDGEFGLSKESSRDELSAKLLGCVSAQGGNHCRNWLLLPTSQANPANGCKLTPPTDS